MVLSPTVRAEVAASVTRQSPQFVELYFADPVRARRCATTGGALQVDFTVRSRFDDDRSINYRVSTVQAEQRISEAVGVAHTVPDKSQQVAVRLAVPDGGDYTLLVELVGQQNLLRVHCAGAA